LQKKLLLVSLEDGDSEELFKLWSQRRKSKSKAASLLPKPNNSKLKKQLIYRRNEIR